MGCSIPCLNRNARPSESTRHTTASTRSEDPSEETKSSCTVVPVASRALVLTFAPYMLTSRERDRYRFFPTLTTTGQETRIRGYCRRSGCDGFDMTGELGITDELVM